MNIKKLVVDALAFMPTSEGFTAGEARRWVREVFRHRTRNYGYSRSETRWAISHGFMPEQVDRLGINKENVDDYISARDYAYLRPLNGTYAKWLTDKVTIFSVFKPFRDLMPECYYQIGKRYNDTFVIPLSAKDAGYGFEEMLGFVRAKGEVSISQANGYAISALKWDGDKYLLDGKKYSGEELKAKLDEYIQTIVLTERVMPDETLDNGVLNLIVINEYGDTPMIGDAFVTYDDYGRIPFSAVKSQSEDSLEEIDIIDDKYREIAAAVVDEKTGMLNGKKIPHWDEICRFVDDFCRFVPQLEFFGCQIIVKEDNFKVVMLENHPEYPTCKPFSKKSSSYLLKKVIQKKKAYSSFSVRLERGARKLSRRIRKLFAKAFFPISLVPYQSVRWPQDVLRDFFANKDATFFEKLRAYRKGFLSYRIKQYGINEDNINEHISDFEYRWLRHINPKYRKWMEDKITVKYICSEHKECFPEYYFHIICKNGNNKVISMMDLPCGYDNEYEDIFKLVQEKKVLALKPDEGSHGDGFYKFTCELVDGKPKYSLNYNEVSKKEVLDILMDTNNQYLVTEYIDMCDELKAIYDGAVNTVRMLVYKKDGITPEIGNCYVRIGSKKTGAVDNVGAGGMTAHIDPENGHFYNAKIAIDNQLIDCPIHPDTGAEIDGYLPHWDEVKKDVLDVAAAIPQLEWFGFDLAVTNDGIKFPEINRFPDYPSVEKYSEGTRDYLMYKLKKKKEKYGIDKKPERKLINLPKRKHLSV